LLGVNCVLILIQNSPLHVAPSSFISCLSYLFIMTACFIHTDHMPTFLNIVPPSSSMATDPFCSTCGRLRPPLRHCAQLSVLCTSALSRAHLGSPHRIVDRDGRTSKVETRVQVERPSPLWILSQMGGHETRRRVSALSIRSLYTRSYNLKLLVDFV
jgi:hypothetical protein